MELIPKHAGSCRVVWSTNIHVITQTTGDVQTPDNVDKIQQDSLEMFLAMASQLQIPSFLHSISQCLSKIMEI